MIRTLKITLLVARELGPLARDELEALGMQWYTFSSSRSVILSAQGKFLGFGEDRVYESPVDCFEFHIRPDLEFPVLTFLSRKLSLASPGRGSIFSERIRLEAESPASLQNEPEVPEEEASPEVPIFSDLLLISCIVQRGKGNDVARAALHSVAGVPWISYGTGAGLRERLGLVRVTIPAEKEVVNLAVSREDGPGILDTLVREARLNQPGQGFIYSCPVHMGLLNTRLSLDRSRHMASMEQVIQSMDLLRGSSAWRRKAADSLGIKSVSPEVGEELDLTFYCPQGQASELVEAARSAGAVGATIRKIRVAALGDSDRRGVTPAMEAAHLVIRSSLEDSILQALTEGGLFRENVRGYCEFKPVAQSFNYRASRR